MTQTRSKEELLAEIKANLAKNRDTSKPASFEEMRNMPLDLDEPDSVIPSLHRVTGKDENGVDILDTIWEDTVKENVKKVAESGTVINDYTPIYETLSVADLMLSGTWPPTALPARTLVPYLKRMKKDITALVVGDVSGANIRYLYNNVPNLSMVYTDIEESQKSDLFRENLLDFITRIDVDDGVMTYDLVFIANVFPTPEQLSSLYKRVNENGYFGGCNYNSDKNIQILKDFRRANKIGVPINVTESSAWFWKIEEYAQRNIVVTGTPTNPVKFNPNDSHLKIDYLKKHGNGRIFVETGTYMGQTVELLKDLPDFSEINSIELNEELANLAKIKFADDEKVKIWQGDSIDVLQTIISKTNEPMTFWLDAHASGNIKGGRSGGSPVLDELKAIKASPIKTHTIMIDDVRLFGSAEWSYVKLEDALKLIEEINPNYKISFLDGQVKNDILCASIR